MVRWLWTPICSAQRRRCLRQRSARKPPDAHSPFPVANMKPASHRDLILDQFTRQATPFSTAKTIADEAALRLLVEFSGAGPGDTVLDVACGGGLVVCAFAQTVRHATGIDVTPAMLERAKALAESRASQRELGSRRCTVATLSGRELFRCRVTLHVPSLSGPARGSQGDAARLCPGRPAIVADVEAASDPVKARRVQSHGEAARSIARPRHARSRVERAVQPCGLVSHA